MAKQMPEAVMAYIRELGRQGGVARRLALSQQERTRQAKHAAAARWGLREQHEARKAS